ncbi:hypothetical protein [Neopusillimonas maritima]|jgi:hypothetical protein|uniref:Uncharacterized protein n=1 Tax=Neopusillimonas maritima TaxID=2026239 RepID=A0ABX9MY03_9BURK|nr:hypothetical protein [Neopusillimonas maritima]RII83855.1 hypothetical protein CJO09_01020 [Neopusillimonas maritima]
MKNRNFKVKIDVHDYDKLAKNVSQLRALLISLSGNGYQSFIEMGSRDQESLLWLAQDLAIEIDKSLRY